MTGFTVDYAVVIGGAHVGHAMWHETFHGNYGTAGHWVNDSSVHGYYRRRSSNTKVAWIVNWHRS